MRERLETLKYTFTVEGETEQISYKGYPYYQDNPALSIHEPIKEILAECGII